MKFQLRAVFFLFGGFIGFGIGLIALLSSQRNNKAEFSSLSSLDSFKRWLESEHLQVLKTNEIGSVSMAQYLYDRVEVFCVVLGSKQRQARAVVGTWGRHCNFLTFVANFKDRFVDVSVKTPPNDKQLLLKILQKLVQNGSFDDTAWYRWLFLTDDTTFANIENLRYLLAPLDSRNVYYLGHAVEKSLPREFKLIVNVLTGGIVLSQGAVLKLLLAFDSNCSETTTSLENTIATCLAKQNGVGHTDTRDPNGSARFLARSLESLLVRKKMSPYDNFLKGSVFTPRLGVGCCSSQAISFHGVNALDMHFYEYLVNRLIIGVPRKASVPLRSEYVPPISSEGYSRNLPAEPRDF